MQNIALPDDTNFSLTIIWILVDCKVMSWTLTSMTAFIGDYWGCQHVNMFIEKIKSFQLILCLNTDKTLCRYSC